MPVGLGHALSRRAMPGGTATHDRSASHTMAALRRGGLMPQADVDPRRRRATRDPWRRSQHRMPQRAELYAPIQQTGSRDLRSDPWGRIATPQTRRGLLARFEHGCGQPHRTVDAALIDCDDPLLTDLERDIEPTAHGHEPASLARWRPMPGGGNILARVRLDGIEDLARCPRAQACGSSCRVGKRARASHGQRSGPSGQRLGNAPLPWVFAEAAGLLRQHNAPAKKSLMQLATRHGKGQALAIPAHTRGRALYCLRTQQVACDQGTSLATSRWRARTSRTAHGSHRGKRPHHLRIAPSAQARGT